MAIAPRGTLQSLRAAGAWKKARHVLQRSRSAGLQPGSGAAATDR